MKRRHKTSKFAREDVISNMPDIVITNILDRLPLQDAVRTSVLARNWRFKWTLFSQLIFDEEFYSYLSKTKNSWSYARIISRLLLHLRGAITKFVLIIPNRMLVDAGDISSWIFFLSRKGIKDITIENTIDEPPTLPTHLFSCFELKHLKICNCCFHPPPTFHGFSNLLSLELRNVRFGSSDYWEFFSRCRLLESLNLVYFYSSCKEKPHENVELENLKILSLTLLHLDHIVNSSTIFELLGSLPKLQELDLDFSDCEFTEGGSKKMLPTSFPCLKALKLLRMDLDNDLELSCAFELIRSFPNLQYLEIRTEYSSTLTISRLEVDYNTMGPLRLRNIVFKRCCDSSESDLTMIKYLLAYSPFLEKFVIHLDARLEPDKKFVFARKVLKLQRAYPAVDIDLS